MNPLAALSEIPTSELEERLREAARNAVDDAIETGMPPELMRVVLHEAAITFVADLGVLREAEAPTVTGWARTMLRAMADRALEHATGHSQAGHA